MFYDNTDFVFKTYYINQTTFHANTSNYKESFAAFVTYSVKFISQLPHAITHSR